MAALLGAAAGAGSAGARNAGRAATEAAAGAANALLSAGGCAAAAPKLKPEDVEGAKVEPRGGAEEGTTLPRKLSRPAQA